MANPKVSKVNQGGTLYDIYDASAVHSIEDLNLDNDNVELLSNKVTEIDDESTDTQYPSAKAVYELFTSLYDYNEEEF